MITAIALFAALEASQPMIDPVDREEIRQCLLFEDDYSQCIGAVSRPCLSSAEGMTTTGAVECSARENRVWDEILNDSYGRVMERWAGEDEWSVSIRTRLRDTQRAWIALRDAECAYEAELGGGGGTLGRQIRAGCLARATAERAIWMMAQEDAC